MAFPAAEFVFLFDGDPSYHLHGGVKIFAEDADHLGGACDMTVCGRVLSDGRTKLASSAPRTEAARTRPLCLECEQAA